MHRKTWRVGGVLLGLVCSAVAGTGAAGIAPAGQTPAAEPKKEAKPFLDEKKAVGPGQEWLREVVSRQGGRVAFRVQAPGPFSVFVVTDRGYKAIQAKGPIQKQDVLTMIDSQESVVEGSVRLPPGSSWWIVENRGPRAGEFRLQCYAVTGGAEDESPWKPRAAHVPQLRQEARLGEYRWQVPQGFVAKPIHQPPGRQISMWLRSDADGNPVALCLATILSHPKDIEEATSRPRQAMVNATAGMAESMKMTLTQRHGTETGVIDGLEFARMRWAGRLPTGEAMHGYTYLAATPKHAIMIILVSTGEEAEKLLALLESSVATFRKQNAKAP
jgi:hypothetical protein